MDDQAPEALAQQSALIDIELKRQELAMRASEQANRDEELALRRKELESSKWRSPLVVAIFAASLAGLSNAVVTIVNGRNERNLEEFKAESQQVLEMIKTGGSADKAADNLEFLLDTGLVHEPERVASIKVYLANRTPGTGVSLPTDSGAYELGADPRLPTSDQKTATDRLTLFTKYLQASGIRAALPRIHVKIDDLNGQINAYFDGASEIKVHPSIVNDPIVIIHEFTLYALKADNPTLIDKSFNSFGYGISDYLPASFLDNPRGGELTARVLKLPKPSLFALDTNLAYTEISSGRRSSQQEVGEVWGSAFWALRAAFGKQEVDRLLLDAWRNTSAKGSERQVITRFLDVLRQKAETALSPEDYARFVKVFADRKFPGF